MTLSGQAPGAPAGSVVQLNESRYPYPPLVPLRTAMTDASGDFSFTVYPGVSTKYQVVLVATGAQAQIVLNVYGRTITKVKAVTLGRAKVVVLLFHPSSLHWGHSRVRWWFASGFHGPFISAPATRTATLSPNLTLLGATSPQLPAGHFRWRACFTAPGAYAIQDPQRPRGCRGRGYSGAGKLPVGFPWPKDVARAAAYLAGREGRTAFAIIDSEGRVSGVNLHWTFVSASVVKAMLLVADLRRLNAIGQHSVDSHSNSLLFPMINVSDNNAATAVWEIVGNSGLYALARAAGMTDYSVTTDWASSQISAADQARFFFEMDSLIPHEFVGYARFLLSTIAGFESWGIPAVARPLGYDVFFKGGWRTTGLGQLVHQVARLERRKRLFALAVMTDGDPSMGYGIDTIQGVTQALLG